MPLLDVQDRYAPLGRIRIGAKHPEKGYPVALDTLRFTSPSRHLIEAVADLLGGEPRPWKSPNGDEWEVITESDSVECIVGPQRIRASQNYELWSGGGLQRRCDSRTQQDGTPCVCDPPPDRECQPVTHLQVFLPQLPGVTGTWRATTHSYNAAAELPATVDLLARFAEAGRPVRARLSIQKRSSKREGKTKRFTVISLDVLGTANELIAALPPGVGDGVLAIGSSAGAAPAAGRPHLPPAPAAGALPEHVAPIDVIDVTESGPGSGTVSVDAPTPTTAPGPAIVPAPPPSSDVRGSADEDPAAVRALLDDAIATPPSGKDTIPVWDAYCRDLFRCMERLGYWLERNDHGHDSLHAALWVKHGADHLSELRKSTLMAFALEARKAIIEQLGEGKQ